MIRVLCGTEEKTHGEIRYDADMQQPALIGDAVVLGRILGLQKPGQDTEAFLLSLPSRLYGVHWAQVLPEIQAKFNPYHERATGRFASVTGAGIPANITGVHEIANYLMEQHPTITFDFAGMDEESAKQIGDQLERELKANPEAEKTIDYMGTPENVPGYIEADFIKTEGKTVRDYLTPSTGAVTGGVYVAMEDKQRQYTIFNDAFVGDHLHMQDEVEAMQARGWTRELKPDVTPGAFLVKHEFGHVLYNTVLLAYGENGGPIKYKDNFAGTMIDTTNAWFSSHVDRARNVSGYGYNGGPMEAIADAYAQTTQAVHPSMFSHDVANMFNVMLPNGIAHVVKNPTDIGQLESTERAKAEKQINDLRTSLGIPTVEYMG